MTSMEKSSSYVNGVYVPFYKRHPNKFVRYESVRFNHGIGLTGEHLVAHYLNKKGKSCKEVVCVKWDHPNHLELRRNYIKGVMK